MVQTKQNDRMGANTGTLTVDLIIYDPDIPG